MKDPQFCVYACIWVFQCSNWRKYLCVHHVSNWHEHKCSKEVVNINKSPAMGAWNFLKAHLCVCVCMSVRDTSGENGIHVELLGRPYLSLFIRAIHVVHAYTHFPLRDLHLHQPEGNTTKDFPPTSFTAPQTRGPTTTWAILSFSLTDHKGRLSRKGDGWSHYYEPLTKMSHITCPEYKIFPGSSGSLQNLVLPLSL